MTKRKKVSRSKDSASRTASSHAATGSRKSRAKHVHEWNDYGKCNGCDSNEPLRNYKALHESAVEANLGMRREVEKLTEQIESMATQCRYERGWSAGYKAARKEAKIR